MIYSLYVKIGLGLAIVFLLFGSGFYFGGLSSKSKLHELQLTYEHNTATALLAQKTASESEADRLRSVLETYEKAYLTPVDPGISHRVFIYASAASCSLSSRSSNTGGTVTASPEPRGFEDALQSYINACSRDALRLNAIQAAWPR